MTLSLLKTVGDEDNLHANSCDNTVMPARKLGAFLDSGFDGLIPHAELVIEIRARRCRTAAGKSAAIVQRRQTIRRENS